MSKIYVVISSSGYYEDYSCWNTKAFYNKSEAEAYALELDRIHTYTPQFITPKFEDAICECQELAPEWEPFNDYPITDRNAEDYAKWMNEQNDKQIDAVIDLLYQRGIFITRQMYDEYYRWENNRCEDWHKSRVEEIELI